MANPDGASVSRMGSMVSDQLTDPVALVAAFILVAYVVITIDRRRDASSSKDDTQVGIKLVIFGLMAVALLSAASATEHLLAFVLGGFKGGWKAMRGPVASVIAMGGPAVALYMFFLPRTNYQERPAAERLATGLVAAFAGAGLLVGLDHFLRFLFAGAAWVDISAGLASVGVWGGLAVLSVMRLGTLSGWRALPRVPQMPMAPPMSGMQPPPGGMPPLGGGYPPQQGGGGAGWPGQ